jgi:hypothetical protein
MGTSGVWRYEKWIMPDGTKLWKGFALYQWGNIAITISTGAGLYKTAELSIPALPSGVSLTNIIGGVFCGSDSVWVSYVERCGRTLNGSTERQAKRQ